jgi:hypothetical protein
MKRTMTEILPEMRCLNDNYEESKIQVEPVQKKYDNSFVM